jgi:ankyrin repeat protein
VAKLFGRRLLSATSVLSHDVLPEFSDAVIDGFRSQRTVGKRVKLRLCTDSTARSLTGNAADAPRETEVVAVFDDYSELRSSTLVAGCEVKDDCYVTIGSLTLHFRLLECAVAFDDLETVRKLSKRMELQTSADLSGLGAYGESLLIQACRMANFDVFQELLTAGADPNQSTNDGCTVLHWIFMLAGNLRYISELFSGTIKPGLIDQQCMTSYPLHGQWPLQLTGTPLAFAISAGSVEAVKVLLALGANPAAPAFKAKSSWTPLHLAAKYHSPRILELLIDATGVPRNRSGSLTLAEYLNFPSLQITCALAVSSPVERYAMNAGEYLERLNETVSMFPLKSLELSCVDGRTALMQAIDFNDYDVVTALLHREPKLARLPFIDPTNALTITYPLHYSAQISARHEVEGSIRTVEALLLDPRKQLKDRDSKLRTPLHFAATGPSSRITRYLLEKGADLYARDNQGRSALHYSKSASNLAALLDHGAFIDGVDRNGVAAIHLAALEGAEDRVYELVQRQAKLDVVDKDHGSPLHCAVLKRSPGVITSLLKTKIQIDVQNQLGNTALHLAAQTNRADLVLLLLDHGAHPWTMNHDGYIALDLAILSQGTRAIRSLITHSRVQPGVSDYIGRSLHICVSSGDEASLHTLLDASHSERISVNMDIRDKRSRTPLHEAALSQRAEIAQLLIRFGAAIESVDQDGATPFLLACRGSDKEIQEKGGNALNLCQTLLRYGASARVEDTKGNTPWRYAYQREDYPLMNFLMLHCASLFDSTEWPSTIAGQLVLQAIHREEWEFVVTGINCGLIQFGRSHMKAGFDLPDALQIAVRRYALLKDMGMVRYIFGICGMVPNWVGPRRYTWLNGRDLSIEYREYENASGLINRGTGRDAPFCRSER